MIMITSCANSFLRRSHTDTTTPPPTASEKWARRFLNRHPEYYIRKQKTIDTARKNSHDPDDILEWFQKYKATCDERRIQCRDRYNFDETVFRIGVGKDQWIITRDPSRQSYIASSSNRGLVTLCESISGDGEVLPPMIILPSVLHLEQWYTSTGLEYNVLVATSETGYSNDELSLGWLRHFERYSARRQLGT